MKQIIQDLKHGNTILEEVPAPQVKSGQVLIQTSKSLVSLGTERMLVAFGKANYLDKAIQQPGKVKMVLDKVKTDGLKPTIDAVLNKLNQPLPLGYCNVGCVVGIGKGVSEFKIGDRVASNGNHAEFVSVPKNLVAPIPDNVSDEQACFTVIGAIALQGIRLMKPTLGETIVVVGLGLIGLLTASLLKANGCKVVGFDFDACKVAKARSKGITAVNPSEGGNQVKFVESFSNGIGADGVIITASNKSNKIISQSATMCRKRGRIVLIGVIGLDISREDFYKKEISFQVSCSYGAGRYDSQYEDKGNDYPIAYVRWTVKRNFEAVLHAIGTGQIEVDSLITERVKLEDYLKVYGDMKKEGSIASILSYDTRKKQCSVVKITENSFTGNKGVVGIIGAGNFTSAMLLPKLKNTTASLKYIASAGGLSGTTMAKRYGISNSTTDYKEILKDDEVDLVMVTTRHNQHTNMVVDSLNSGKHVFVEKPLALNQEELDQVITAYIEHNKTVNLGFNRRFAPLAKKMKQLLGTEPMNIVATMNAGTIPSDVWVHDMEIGGGRIIGEACHYIDLCSYLVGAKVKAVCMNAMGVNPSINTDNVSILLAYENGSNAVINYFSNGSKSYAKERVEVFSQERVLIMDNWRKLKGYGFKGFSTVSSRQDKGHANQFNLLIKRIQEGGEAIIPFDEIINTTKASFAAIESLQSKTWVALDD